MNNLCPNQTPHCSPKTCSFTCRSVGGASNILHPSNPHTVLLSHPIMLIQVFEDWPSYVRKTVHKSAGHQNLIQFNTSLLQGAASATKLENTTLKLALPNVRSPAGKTAIVCDLIIENKLDIFLLTETWLDSNDSFTPIGITT